MQSKSPILPTNGIRQTAIKISGANDYTIKSGGEFYALAGVTAVDTCGNDITSNIEVFGNVVTTRKGKYKVTYSVTDVLKRTSSVTITVTVQ
mgnify:CR=1 FL=1